MPFPQFEGLMAAISGIVFLGTPHITKKNEDGMQQLLLTMRSDLMSGSKRPLEQEDLSSIVDICWHFAEMQPRIPILNCYETQQTKLQQPKLRAAFWKPKRVVV